MMTMMMMIMRLTTLLLLLLRLLMMLMTMMMMMVVVVMINIKESLITGSVKALRQITKASLPKKQRNKVNKYK